jgi:hypothetical protein
MTSAIHSTKDLAARGPARCAFMQPNGVRYGLDTRLGRQLDIGCESTRIVLGLTEQQAAKAFGVTLRTYRGL